MRNDRIAKLLGDGVLFYKNEKLCITNSHNKIKKSNTYNNIKEYCGHLGELTASQMVYHYINDFVEIPKCPECGNKVNFNKFGLGYYKTCSRKYATTKERNGFYDKKHTEETKIRMKENHADFTGERNPFRNKYNADENFRIEFKNSHIELWKGRDETWRRNFGEKVGAGQLGTIKCHKKHLHGHGYSDKSGIYFFRSSWELRLAMVLENTELVESFKVEPFAIPYYKNGRKHHTIVDFLINFYNEIQLLVEIKPDAFMEDSYNKFHAIECFALENDYHFLVMATECFTKNKIEKYLKRGYNGDFELTELIRRGSETPLSITSKM